MSTPEIRVRLSPEGVGEVISALRQVVADYCDESEVDDELRDLRVVVARG